MKFTIARVPATAVNVVVQRPVGARSCWKAMASLSIDARAATRVLSYRLLAPHTWYAVGTKRSQDTRTVFAVPAIAKPVFFVIVSVAKHTRISLMRLSNHTYSILLVVSLIVSSSFATGAAPPPPAVFVAEVKLAQFADRLEALGTLRANESVILTASVTETVTNIFFDDGDRVMAGKALLEMTSAEEHALLEEARATVGEARRQYERVKFLEAKGTAAKSLLDERRREWETARARLTAIESRLDDRLVRAPFSGVVGLRNISVGALVEPGDVITTLDDDSVMKMDFSVPSTYLEVLRPGLVIVARGRAYPKRSFQGVVKSVDSRIDPVTRSLVVRAVLPNDDRSLKPGMLMQVELLGNPRETLVIPEEALIPQGSKQFVLVVDEANGHTVVRREVQLGGRRPGEAEILQGLASGEKVITDGAFKVSPGQAVIVHALDDGRQPLREILKSAAKSKTTP